MLPANLPWFDAPNAPQLLETRRRTEHLSDHQFEQLTRWHRDGYITLEDAVPRLEIDAMLDDIDGLWGARSPIPTLRIDDLHVAAGDPPGLSHAALLALDPDTRARMMREQPWRIHGFWQHSAPTAAIFRNAILSEWASLILGRSARPTYTINFTFGSRQALHQDTAVFFVAPMNNLVGAWLACEDIHPDSGPLVIYPGSHREPMFGAFQDYPKTNLRNCKPEYIDAYHSHLDRASSRYDRLAYTPKKGEVLLWHGMLIHGGDEIREQSLTRRSYVCHYFRLSATGTRKRRGPSTGDQSLGPGSRSVELLRTAPQPTTRSAQALP